MAVSWRSGPEASLSPSLEMRALVSVPADASISIMTALGLGSPISMSVGLEPGALLSGARGKSSAEDIFEC